MMDHRFTDEEMSAFLDGEASVDLARRIEVARETDPAFAADLDMMQAAGASIKGGFDAMLQGAPVMPAIASPKNRTQWRSVAAGLVAGICLTGAVAAAWTATRPPAWERYVAAYQALYIPATVAGASLGQDTARARIAELSPALGIDLSALPDLPGLDLRRAQLLGYEGQPLMQIAYADADGQPVALCIIALSGSDTAPVMRQMEGMPAAAWSTATHAFLLIGGQAETVAQAARVAQAAL